MPATMSTGERRRPGARPARRRRGGRCPPAPPAPPRRRRPNAERGWYLGAAGELPETWLADVASDGRAGAGPEPCPGRRPGRRGPARRRVARRPGTRPTEGGVAVPAAGVADGVRSRRLIVPRRGATARQAMPRSSPAWRRAAAARCYRPRQQRGAGRGLLPRRPASAPTAAYCEAHGWAVVARLPRRGQERPDRRPRQAARLRRGCSPTPRPGRFDVVVVHKLDRFARNLRVTLETLDRLRARRRRLRLDHRADGLHHPDRQGDPRHAGRLRRSTTRDNLSLRDEEGQGRAQGAGALQRPAAVRRQEGRGRHAGARPATTLPRPRCWPSSWRPTGKSDREVAAALNAAGYRTTGNRGRQPVHQGHRPRACCRTASTWANCRDGRAAGSAARPARGRARRALFDAAQARARPQPAPARRRVRAGARQVALRPGGLRPLRRRAALPHAADGPARAGLLLPRRQADAPAPQRRPTSTSTRRRSAAYLRDLPPSRDDYQARSPGAVHAGRPASGTTPTRRAARRSTAGWSGSRSCYEWGDLERASVPARARRAEAELAGAQARRGGGPRWTEAAAFLRDAARRRGRRPTRRSATGWRGCCSPRCASRRTRVVAVLPRPGLRPFFALGCQPKGGTSGSDGIGPSLTRYRRAHDGRLALLPPERPALPGGQRPASAAPRPGALAGGGRRRAPAGAAPGGPAARRLPSDSRQHCAPRRGGRARRPGRCRRLTRPARMTSVPGRWPGRGRGDDLNRRSSHGEHTRPRLLARRRDHRGGAGGGLPALPAGRRHEPAAGHLQAGADALARHAQRHAGGGRQSAAHLHHRAAPTGLLAPGEPRPDGWRFDGVAAVGVAVLLDPETGAFGAFPPGFAFAPPSLAPKAPAGPFPGFRDVDPDGTPRTLLVWGLVAWTASGAKARLTWRPWQDVEIVMPLRADGVAASPAEQQLLHAALTDVHRRWSEMGPPTRFETAEALIDAVLTAFREQDPPALPADDRATRRRRGPTQAQVAVLLISSKASDADLRKFLTRAARHWPEAAGQLTSRRCARRRRPSGRRRSRGWSGRRPRPAEHPDLSPCRAPGSIRPILVRWQCDRRQREEARHAHGRTLDAVAVERIIHVATAGAGAFRRRRGLILRALRLPAPRPAVGGLSGVPGACAR